MVWFVAAVAMPISVDTAPTAPDKVAGYQRYFAGGSPGESAQALGARFERSFALPAPIEASLQAAVDGVPG